MKKKRELGATTSLFLITRPLPKTSENVNKAFFHALEIFVRAETNQKIEQNESVNLSNYKGKSDCYC